MAVEGEGEQSFVTWLQRLIDQYKLPIHLDCKILNSGGYSKMLEAAVKDSRYKLKNKANILLLDTDRAERGDDLWSLDKLRAEADKKKFKTCFQRPKQEGLLLRMFKGNECLVPNSNDVDEKLLKQWPEYKKPINTHTLNSKFILEDLIRVARWDEDIKNLLSIIGLH